MVKVLFLDLDGTVRQTKSGRKFINEPEDQELINGAFEGIFYYYQRDWKIIGVTNQGGVGRGYKSIKSCIEEQQLTLKLTKYLQCIYFCPDYAGLELWRVDEVRKNQYREFNHLQFGSFRKPGAGMINFALGQNFGNSRPEKIEMVGDRPEDEQCAKAANIEFRWADEWREAAIALS